jgi:hypothetical protein
MRRGAQRSAAPDFCGFASVCQRCVGAAPQAAVPQAPLVCLVRMAFPELTAWLVRAVHPRAHARTHIHTRAMQINGGSDCILDRSMPPQMALH